MTADSGLERVVPLKSSSRQTVAPTFRVLPVLDLMGGHVVHGVAGRRHAYRPIVSSLTPSSRPLDVAIAFRKRFGLEELYLADLDAIAGSPPARQLYDELRRHGFHLWVDAGLRRAETAPDAVERVIAGLETLTGPEELRRLCDHFGERVAFSLDLHDGRLLGDRTAWGSDPADVVRLAVAAGVGSVIVLDLARVGVGGGVGTESLCARLMASHPGLDLLAGGGIRGPEDLKRLRESGASGALVASALHDGRLQSEHVHPFGLPG